MSFTLPSELFAYIYSQVHDLATLRNLLALSKASKVMVLKHIRYLQIPEGVRISSLFNLIGEGEQCPMLSGVVTLSCPSEQRLLPRLRYTQLDVCFDYPSIGEVDSSMQVTAQLGGYEATPEHDITGILELHAYAIQALNQPRLRLYNYLGQVISEVREGYASCFLHWDDGYHLETLAELSGIECKTTKALLSWDMISSASSTSFEGVVDLWLVGKESKPLFYLGALLAVRRKQIKVLTASTRVNLGELAFLTKLEEVRSLVCPCYTAPDRTPHTHEYKPELIPHFPPLLRRIKIILECLGSGLLLSKKHGIEIELYVPRKLVPLMRRRYRHVSEIKAVECLEDLEAEVA